MGASVLTTVAPPVRKTTVAPPVRKIPQRRRLRRAGALLWGDLPDDPRPRIYAAHPVTTYGTAHEARCLGILASLLPTAEIINPTTCYRSTAEWLADWPRVVGTLSGLVVFGDRGDTIGAGVLREIADALAHLLPIACLDCSGKPHELSRVDFALAVLRNPRRVATLRYGAVLDDLATFLGVDPVTA